MAKKVREKKELEQRTFVCEVRAEAEAEGPAVITGRPIVYDSATDLGWFTEIIERGALDRADLTDVRFLVNHDTRGIPLARSRRNNGNSTMLLTTDERGMEIRAQLDTENNADARALYSAVQRGDISGMSFMFGVDGEEWEELESDHPTRRIKSISTVVEVSAVTWPAYEATEIDARSVEALENARRAVETARAARTVKPVETGADKKELELLKAKIQIM